jgi:hypothetical protein
LRPRRKYRGDDKAAYDEAAYDKIAYEKAAYERVFGDIVHAFHEASPGTREAVAPDKSGATIPMVLTNA